MNLAGDNPLQDEDDDDDKCTLPVPCYTLLDLPPAPRGNDGEPESSSSIQIVPNGDISTRMGLDSENEEK